MFKTIHNAWKDPELRKKLLFTVFIVIIFRIGSIIPVPFLDADALRNFMGARVTENSFFGFVNMLSGGAFSHGTLFALSIQPYINASIIMQLMTVVIPSLEKLQKEGEEGRKKMTAITRVLTVTIGVLQATMFYLWLRNAGRVTMYNEGFAGIFSAIVIVSVLTAGTALIMWLGEQINDKGVGNGISILLFAGIVARMPMLITTLWGYISLAIESPNMNFVGRENWYFYIFVPLFVVLLFVIIWLITYTNDAERRIPIQYAKRVVGRKMYGGQSSILPLKVCSVGVMPLIFAYSFMAFPSTLIQLFGGSESGLGHWWSRYMSYYSPLYMIVTALLIIAFTYFYTSISFQPDEMAKNIQQQGGVIPHVRPGKPTADFLARTNNRLTLFAALFLAVLATLPNLFTVGLQTSVPFAASSLLIAVSVVLETKRQLDDLLVSRNYDTLT